MHGQPFPAPYPPVRRQRAERRREPAPEARRGHEVHPRRQRHEVRVRRVDRHELRERSGPGEPRLGLPRAYLRLAGQAELTPPAPAHERHRHLVPGPPPRHLRPDGRDDPGKLVPPDVRQRHRVVPPPGVPVGPAHSGSPYRDDHPVRRANGIGDLLDRRQHPVPGVDDRPHEPPPARSKARSSRLTPSSEAWYSTVRPLRCRSISPPRCRTARCCETAEGVTPNRRASALVVAGDRSAPSSLARGAPSSASTAPSSAAAGPVPEPASPRHTVAAPRAGYSSVVCVLVARLTDQSGQMNTLGTST